MNVYLVEDVLYNPGYIYAVFAKQVDADAFARHLNASHTEFKSEVQVFERTLFYGQPPIEGYNE